ncbi:hypothetical protein OVA24_20270 [Luteolibacter sp. SL250]|uniref:hypothetical protein n=1 Tax=Luteolibacter sp. SL250 TaxID=2995170 RepID=UPI0022703512|nr:hypothetical protein [Luteolibacter sp. SL250]WAC19562.1 hypothetical protein OVA24_20270 [Luteolibacter sp. SL250]
MSDQARVSSIDALELFRADLIQYIMKARTALEEASSDVRRTQDWLDRDRYLHWSNEIRKRTKLLRQAEQELYSANLTNPFSANPLQKMAVHRAKRALEEAEDKMRTITRWRHRFERMASPHLRGLDPLLSLLAQDLPNGVASLAGSIKALQAYAEKRTPAPNPPPTDAQPPA